MKSRVKRGIDYQHLHWQKHVNNYPTSQPAIVRFQDEYSDDLVESYSSVRYNNAGTIRHNGSTGGNFETVRRTYRESSTLLPGVHTFTASNGPQGRMEAIPRAHTPVVLNGSFPEAAASSDATLKALGRLAISRVSPTTSEVDLSVALAEIIREGFPSMTGLASYGKGKRTLPERVADENLNYEFAQKPFMNDVQSAITAYQRSQEIWDSYVRNAGKVLRRRYDFPEELSVVRSSGTGNPVPYGNRFFYSGNSFPKETVTTTKRSRWFIGHFKYAIPDNPFYRNVSRWNKLYGAVPDVETLWNLAPWSWAADWIGDFGTSVSNFAAFQSDGLVLLNGFMMEFTSVKVEQYLGPVIFTSRPGQRHFFSQTFLTERKRRVVASPYGFHTDWSGFSPRQLGILASLGITRGRGGSRW